MACFLRFPVLLDITAQSARRNGWAIRVGPMITPD
jgi:hypothetical protein